MDVMSLFLKKLFFLFCAFAEATCRAFCCHSLAWQTFKNITIYTDVAITLVLSPHSQTCMNMISA